MRYNESKPVEFYRYSNYIMSHESEHVFNPGYTVSNTLLYILSKLCVDFPFLLDWLIANK